MPCHTARSIGRNRTNPPSVNTRNEIFEADGNGFVIPFLSSSTGLTVISSLLASHEDDGVRKEKERLTAAWPGLLLSSAMQLKVNKGI